MNLDFVRSFYWVAKLKSMTLAAERMGIVQTAMSARIAALERELNTPLLDRRDRQVRLTPEGVRFLEDAARLIGLWDEIKAGLGSGTQRAVSLRVGAIESVLHSWLIPWIEQLRKEQPGLELELTVETTPMLVELVRRGTLDLALAAAPVHADEVRSRELPSLPMVFVGKHTLHKRRKYTLEQLAEGELLTFQRGSQPNAALHGLLHEAGIETARVHAISSISAMVRLVSGGFGVATLPRAALEHFADTEGLRVLACETQLAPLPVHASWRMDPLATGIGAIVDSLVAFTGGREAP